MGEIGETCLFIFKSYELPVLQQSTTVLPNLFQGIDRLADVDSAKPILEISGREAFGS